MHSALRGIVDTKRAPQYESANNRKHVHLQRSVKRSASLGNWRFKEHGATICSWWFSTPKWWLITAWQSKLCKSTVETFHWMLKQIFLNLQMVLPSLEQKTDSWLRSRFCAFVLVVHKKMCAVYLSTLVAHGKSCTRVNINNLSFQISNGLFDKKTGQC